MRELKTKVATLEEELSRAKQEVQVLRKQNSTMDSEQHEQDKLMNQMQMRIAVLEQELKDKEQVLSKSSDLLDSEQDKKVGVTQFHLYYSPLTLPEQSVAISLIANCIAVEAT